MIEHNVDQNSIEWFQLRAGKPTASMFDKILTPKTLKPAVSDYHYQLAAEVLFGVDDTAFQGNDATDHGAVYEKHAVEAYEALTRERAREVGFVTDDAMTMGCSPDRLIGDDGLIEIKCPYAKKNFVRLACEIADECPPEYRLQIQGQLMLTGRKWCDLVVFHPEAFDPKIVRVFPDLEIHRALMEQIKVVLQRRDDAVLKMTGF